MSQKFESVEKHLYKRQYQTVDGNWSTLFYAIFTCWDGRRRTFPTGDRLSDARDEFGRLKTLNKGRYDFDGEKRKREQAKQPKPERLTVGGYIPEFLASKKEMPSYNFWKVCTAHIDRHIGSV